LILSLAGGRENPGERAAEVLGETEWGVAALRQAVEQ
jgi:hypothetical protein